MANRTADETRSGRVMSTQCMFHTALQHERDLRLNFWEERTPRIEGLGVSVAGPPTPRARTPAPSTGSGGWTGTPSPSTSGSRWRAGWSCSNSAAANWSSTAWPSPTSTSSPRAYDLVLVAAGKGELVSLFGRDAARSPYDTPQRALAVSYVHGLGPRPEHPDYEAVALQPGPRRRRAVRHADAHHQRARRHPVLGGRPGRPARRVPGRHRPVRAPGHHAGADGAVHPVGVRAGHQGRADRRGRHARRAVRPDRTQPDRRTARRRPGARRRRRRGRQRPDHRPGLQLGRQVRRVLPGQHRRPRRPAVRRRVDAGHLRPLLGDRPARHQVDERDARPRRPSTSWNCSARRAPCRRWPTGSPTASTTRPTSSTSSTSRRRRRPIWPRWAAPGASLGGASVDGASVDAA